MIHLYHKNRLRFSDPRGSWLKHFEKPIGRKENVQGKAENKQRMVDSNDMIVKPDFLAMNFSLQSLSKSTSNYENRSDSPPGQVLDVKITKTEDKTKSEIETTKRNPYYINDGSKRCDEDSPSVNSSGSLHGMDYFISNLVNFNIFWSYFITFAGISFSILPKISLWIEQSPHWTLELIILLLLLAGDSAAMVKIRLLLVGIYLGAKLSRKCGRQTINWLDRGKVIRRSPWRHRMRRVPSTRLGLSKKLNGQNLQSKPSTAEPPSPDTGTQSGLAQSAQVNTLNKQLLNDIASLTARYEASTSAAASEIMELKEGLHDKVMDSLATAFASLEFLNGLNLMLSRAKAHSSQSTGGSTDVPAAPPESPQGSSDTQRGQLTLLEEAIAALASRQDARASAQDAVISGLKAGLDDKVMDILSTAFVSREFLKGLNLMLRLASEHEASSSTAPTPEPTSPSGPQQQGAREAVGTSVSVGSKPLAQISPHTLADRQSMLPSMAGSAPLACSHAVGPAVVAEAVRPRCVKTLNSTVISQCYAPSINCGDGLSSPIAGHLSKVADEKAQNALSDRPHAPTRSLGGYLHNPRGLSQKREPSMRPYVGTLPEAATGPFPLESERNHTYRWVEGRLRAGPDFRYNVLRKAGETQEQAEHRAASEPGVTVEQPPELKSAKCKQSDQKLRNGKLNISSRRSRPTRTFSLCDYAHTTLDLASGITPSAHPRAKLPDTTAPSVGSPEDALGPKTTTC